MTPHTLISSPLSTPNLHGAYNNNISRMYTFKQREKVE